MALRPYPELLLIAVVVGCSPKAKDPGHDSGTAINASARTADRLVEKVDDIARQALDGPVAGLSIAVMKEGRTILARGYGFADVENKVPATEHTVYRIGSLTKQFTAAAVLKLSEQGKVGLDDVITEHIFRPAGLHQTSYCDTKRIITHRAQGYRAAGGELQNDDPISMTQPLSSGALCSTVVDLLGWQSALHGGEVVNDESLHLMQSPGRLADGTKVAYGFGLMLGELDGHTLLNHNGEISGFSSQLSHYPDDGITVAVLSNTVGDHVFEVEREVASAALGMR